jgi:hypothetical protein
MMSFLDSSSLVMPGLDPGIHQIDEGGFLISDGLPGQAHGNDK